MVFVRLRRVVKCRHRDFPHLYDLSTPVNERDGLLADAVMARLEDKQRRAQQKGVDGKVDLLSR